MAAFKLNYMLESNNITFNSFAQFQSCWICELIVNEQNHYPYGNFQPNSFSSIDFINLEVKGDFQTHFRVTRFISTSSICKKRIFCNYLYDLPWPIASVARDLKKADLYFTAIMWSLQHNWSKFQTKSAITRLGWDDILLQIKLAFVWQASRSHRDHLHQLHYQQSTKHKRKCKYHHLGQNLLLPHNAKASNET